jgi:hypothetical protein
MGQDGPVGCNYDLRILVQKLSDPRPLAIDTKRRANPTALVVCACIPP